MTCACIEAFFFLNGCLWLDLFIKTFPGKAVSRVKLSVVAARTSLLFYLCISERKNTRNGDIGLHDPRLDGQQTNLGSHRIRKYHDHSDATRQHMDSTHSARKQVSIDYGLFCK